MIYIQKKKPSRPAVSLVYSWLERKIKTKTQNGNFDILIYHYSP